MAPIEVACTSCHRGEGGVPWQTQFKLDLFCNFQIIICEHLYQLRSVCSTCVEKKVVCRTKACHLFCSCFRTTLSTIKMFLSKIVRQSTISDNLGRRANHGLDLFTCELPFNWYLLSHPLLRLLYLPRRHPKIFSIYAYMQKAGDTWDISPQICFGFPQNFRLRTRNQYCTKAIAWGSTI